MVKKLFTYIFIYILLIGCDVPTQPVNLEPDSTSDVYVEEGSCISESYLILDAPGLEMDSNGYYNMKWLDGYTQIFSTLDADIGLSYIKVAWLSDKQHNVEYMGTNELVYLVNTNSYTNGDGIAHTVLGPWENFIGDTIKVYCGYKDNCGFYHLDSLEVILNGG